MAPSMRRRGDFCPSARRDRKLYALGDAPGFAIVLPQSKGCMAEPRTAPRVAPNARWRSQGGDAKWRRCQVAELSVIGAASRAC